MVSPEMEGTRLTDARPPYEWLLEAATSVPGTLTIQSLLPHPFFRTHTDRVPTWCKACSRQWRQREVNKTEEVPTLLELRFYWAKTGEK